VNIRQTKEATEKQEREKELSRVKIRKEDVDLIVSMLWLFKIKFSEKCLVRYATS
jgi:hypothetical protein